MRSTLRTDRDGVWLTSAASTPRGGLAVADAPIRIVIESDGDTRTVRITGELDIASRALVTRRCTEGRARHVVVDLSEVTFVDCGGYGAFVSARSTLARRHRTLTLVGAVGEPRRLLGLIRHIELRAPLQ